MSKKPAFITGANAKIYIDSKHIAYATDVAYAIEAINLPIEVMGRYEVLSNEPIAYSVNGSFTVIRYTSFASGKIDDAAATGNPASKLGNPGAHINPKKMLESSTFDMKIYQKSAEVEDTATGTGTKGVFMVQDCRIVRRGGTMNKRGVLTETYAFVGIIGGDMKEDGSGFIMTAPTATGTDLGS